MGEEVNYASVVFKHLEVSPPLDGKPAKGSHVLRVVALCLGILCVLLASAIIALYVYMTKAISRGQNTKLVSDLRDNHCLTGSLISNLTLANEILQGDHNNLKSLIGQLSKANDILQNVTNNLATQIYELRAEKDNLERRMENMTREKEDLREAMFQFEDFPVNAYCPKQGNVQERVCKPCQDGWLHFQSSCYLSMDPYSGRKTWDEAQENCREKRASLVVIESKGEQEFVYEISYGAINEWKGFWIGLRKTGGRWRWTDGSDLTEGYWVSGVEPSGSYECAESFQQNSQTHLGWEVMSCDWMRQWICEMKAVVLV